MTPVHRSLAGDVIALDLSEEMQIVRDELAEGHARSAKPSGEADRDRERRALSFASMDWYYYQLVHIRSLLPAHSITQDQLARNAFKITATSMTS